jgi:hypothetical protein
LSKFLSFVFCTLFLLLLPSTASAQSYDSTSSQISYNPDTNKLTVEAVWYYQIASNVYWYFGAPNWDLSISKYTSQSNYDNNLPESTNLYNYVASQGQWSQGAYSPGVGRLYGYKELTLIGGYIYRITLVTPKSGYSSHQISGYAPTWFTWSGQAQSAITVDKIHPSDDD